MLETPNEKINNLRIEFVKQNYPEIHNENMMQEAMETFYKKFPEALDKAMNKFIKQFAEEEGLSFKCAKYYVEKHFKFNIELTYPNGIQGNPELILVPRFKTVEELLYEFDNILSYEKGLEFECEKEILENGVGKIKESD